MAKVREKKIKAVFGRNIVYSETKEAKDHYNQSRFGELKEGRILYSLVEAFYLIEKNLVRYRIHTDQLSHRKIGNTIKYLSKVRKNILSQLEESEKEKYVKTIGKYNKQKSFSKKTKDIALKFATLVLPTEISDDLLVFYLNKIRRTR